MGKRGGDLLEDQSYCPNHSETVSMAIANATTDANDQLIDKMDSLTRELDLVGQGKNIKREKLFMCFLKWQWQLSLRSSNVCKR